MNKYSLLLWLVVSTAHAATPVPVVVISSPINLSAGASRVTGTAPLVVYFDATGTTDASVTANPFHDLAYSWNFGDTNATAASTCGAAPAPGEGFWRCGSNPGANSKNTATGPMAVHVYETAGTFSACITVTDGTNVTPSQCSTITVTAADTTFATTNTICVSPSGAFTGCPAGAAHITSSDFDAALASHFANGKRVLFRGGETTTASVHTTINVSSASEIGSYGTGLAKVNWTGAGSANGFLFIALTTSDFRLTGLEFDGTGTTGMAFMSFQNTAWRNVLVINNYVHDVSNFLNNVDWVDSGGFGFYVVNNTFSSPDITSNSDMLITAHGSRVGHLGNSLAQGGFGQQVLRMNTVSYYVLSNNTVSGAAVTKETVAVRSSDTALSRYGIIANNSVSVGPSYVGIFPSSANTNAGVFDLIIERNSIFGSGSGETTNAIQTNAERVTIRNNLINATDVDMTAGISLRGTNGNLSIPSKNVWVYNNSIFSAKVSGALVGIDVDTTASTGNVVKNNLVYSSGITATAISDSGAVATKSNNTGNSGTTTTSPLFAATPPVTPANWKPTTGSYAINNGATVPVWSDFLLVANPPRTIGALNP